MDIWDLHCHLPSDRVPGDALTEQMGNMLEIAGRVDVDKICPFLHVGEPKQNEEVRRALERYRGRALGFVYVEDLGNTRRAIGKLERWVGEGPMVGMKLGGGSGIASKPEYDPVFEKAIELNAVIFQHTWTKLGGDPPRYGGGNFPKESTPQDLVEVAARYPDYPFIMGHAGGDWELGIRVARPHDNVFVGIAGGFPANGFVETAVRELGAERVIYGSDVTGRSFASQVAKVRGANISEDEKQLIFKDNLHGLMRPLLREKGIDV